MTAVLVLIALLAAAGIAERARQSRLRRRIPLRIHVNGTRGKSSVTRLIAAGLRAGGIRTCAKTTGTLPRFILPDGSEVRIFRPGSANIKEQVKIFARAVRERSDALVMECMALQPEILSLSEDAIMQSTIGVITNVRADHLDVMGPAAADVARNLARTCPRNGHLFTSERDAGHLAILRLAAEARAATLVVADEEVPTELMKRFSYIEHAENVSLALAVCRHCGVEPATAIEGMWVAEPDWGALRIHRLDLFGRTLHFVNAFAANDPESTVMIWKKVEERFPEADTRIVLVNSRADRLDRAEQYGEALAGPLKADSHVLIGGMSELVVRTAIRHGLDPATIHDVSGSSADSVLDRILELTRREAVVFGCGNVAGEGARLLHHLLGRATREEAA